VVNARTITGVDRSVNTPTDPAGRTMPGKRKPEDERRQAMVEAAVRVAIRDRLGGLSVRAVAKEAGVSKGLVFFYFGSREGLLLGALDWLLESTLVLTDDGLGEAVGAEAVGTEGSAPVAGSGGATGSGDPSGALALRLRRELSRLPAERERVELFLDYWVMGTAVPEIQSRIRRAFKGYRESLLSLTEAVVAESPERYGGVSPRSLAAAAVSVVEGCALQLMSDPEGFDVERYVAAVEALVRGR
jgi:TetR/AcrR family transcriptional repressor of bet genes